MEVTYWSWAVKLSFSCAHFPNWKHRKFELTKGRLEYKNSNDEIKGGFDRKEILFAEAIEVCLVPHWDGKSITKSYPFPIRVWIAEKPFYFCVATEAQQKKWIAMLNNQPMPRSRVTRVKSEPNRSLVTRTKPKKKS